MNGHTRGHGLSALRWLPNQDRFLRDPHKRKLIRQGNQWGGKTTAVIQEVHWRCTGTHLHFPTRPPPIKVWFVCYSWNQSLEIQEKVWNLVDRSELDPRTRFDPKNGFKGAHKMVLYKNGSQILFKTGKQGSQKDAAALASGSVDLVVIDEPVSERVYNELVKRLSKTGGTMLLSLTPINGPTDYLKALCDRGVIHDHHARCTPSELVPVGARFPLRDESGTPMDADWIAERIAETSESEVDVVIHGGWETREALRQISAFDRRFVVKGTHRATLRQGWGGVGDCGVMLVTDHGELAHHAVWLVIAYQALPLHVKGAPVLTRVVGEYSNPPGADEHDDVDAVTEVLKRMGLRLEAIAVGVGDHNTSGRSKGATSLNEVYTAAFARKMGLPPESPSFDIVKATKGAKSIDYGVRVLNNGLRRSRISVSEHCPGLIEAAERWQGGNDRYKHWIDAWRYGQTYLEDLAWSGLLLHAA